MAIHKQVYSESGSNAAAVTQGSSFVGAYFVMMSDANKNKYGPFNLLEVRNDSTEDGTLHFTTSYEKINAGTSESVKVNAGESYSMNADEGKKFYGFVFINNDAGADMAIGEIKYRAAVVKEIPE